MNAVNLYILTRNIKNNVLPLYEKCISSREEELRVRRRELDVIGHVVNNLLFEHASPMCYDDWFYSFTIPQISKEFDLLKIGKNKVVVNIEIKEKEVDESKIIKQLKRNQYYLSNISESTYSFTCMQNNSGQIEVFQLINNSLKTVKFKDIKNAIELIDDAYISNIEGLFRPRDYLISPINTPERFLKDEYFLTDHQEEIKNKILSGLSNNNIIWGIQGGAGTGKTLLLYDIAKSLSLHYKVIIIHSGILADGHKFLDHNLDNVVIIDAKHADKEIISQFEAICVDETQRLYGSALDSIISLINYDCVKCCVFSYDYAQCLSKTEERRNNPERLRQIEGFIEEKLSTRIRTNKVMASFIHSILRLTDVSQEKMKYDCIDIVYANTDKEADKIIEVYQRKGYKFITFTPSQFVSNVIDHYAQNDNSHHVIGQEFDNVVIILDENFSYSKKGILEAKEHPNPDYLFPKLIYQNITRAREKLCIIVLNNPFMFEILLRIKDNSLTPEHWNRSGKDNE